MKCQHCGAELPAYPDAAIMGGEREQVVTHSYQDREVANDCMVTDYYCNPRCFVAEVDA